MTAASGHAPRRFPGALFNTLHLSIIFKPIVPPLSAALLMLEIKRPIYLPAVGWVSTQGVGLGVKSPCQHHQHQLIPTFHSIRSSGQSVKPSQGWQPKMRFAHDSWREPGRAAGFLRGPQAVRFLLLVSVACLASHVSPQNSVFPVHVSRLWSANGS